MLDIYSRISERLLQDFVANQTSNKLLSAKLARNFLIFRSKLELENSANKQFTSDDVNLWVFKLLKTCS